MVPWLSVAVEYLVALSKHDNPHCANGFGRRSAITIFFLIIIECPVSWHRRSWLSKDLGSWCSGSTLLMIFRHATVPSIQHHFSLSASASLPLDLSCCHDFSCASLLITWPKKAVCLFIIVVFNVLLSLASSRQLLVTLAVHGIDICLRNHISVTSKIDTIMTGTLPSW